MSVLECDRLGCENIMCDYSSHKYGYICMECLNALIDGSITDIEQFMNSEKNPTQCDNIDWEAVVLNEFTCDDE